MLAPPTESLPARSRDCRELVSPRSGAAKRPRSCHALPALMANWLSPAILMWLILVWLATLVFLSAAGNAAETKLTRRERADVWQFQSFYADAGLTEKYVSMADFAADGSVWLAVSDGLYQYDGYRWRRYTTDHGLPSNYVRCVQFDQRGTLWVGTDRGAGTFSDETFDGTLTAGRLAGPSVRRIVSDPDGSLWFCCDQWPLADVSAGLTRLKDGRFRTWDRTDGLPSDYVSDYFRDSRGRQFVLTRKGLAQFDGDRLIQPLQQAGLEDTDTYVWSMVESARHGLLAATDASFFIYQDGAWRRTPNQSEWLQQPKLVATSDGEIYTVSGGTGTAAMYTWADEKFRRASKPLLNVVGGTQFLAEDPHGGVWVGGYERLFRWARRGAPWTKYTDLGTPLFCDSHDGIWIKRQVESDLAIIRRQGNHQLVFEKHQSPVLEDQRNRVWFQGEQAPVIWEGGQRATPVAIAGLSQLKLQLVDRRGTVWLHGVSAAGNLVLTSQRSDESSDASKDKWTTVELPFQGDEYQISSVLQDPENGAWAVVSRRGLPPYRLLHVADGTAAEIPIPARAQVSHPVRMIIQPQHGILLGGVFGLLHSTDRGATWSLVDTPSPSAVQVLGGLDEWWVSFSGHAGGEASVARLRDGVWKTFRNHQGRFIGSREDQEWYLATHGRIQVIRAGREKMPPPLTTPFSSRANAMVADHDGAFWIGHSGDVYRYKPTRFAPETELMATPSRVQQGENVELRVVARERYRPQTYRAAHFVSTSIDDGPWSDFKPLQQAVRLPLLDLGQHVIRVRVQNEAQLIDPTPAILRLTVLPLPIQMRPWFAPVVVLSILIIVLLAILAMINWMTIRRMAKGLKEEVVRKEERLDLTEREFQLLFEDSQDAICLFDNSGTLQACNPAARDLLGLGIHDRSSIQHLFVDSTEYAQFRLQLEMEGWVRGGRYQVRGGGEKEFDAILSANTRTSGDGKIVGHQMILRDISDLLALQRRLTETQKMEAVGRMAGGIAHDFNNFLAVVMYGADFIRLQKHGDAEVEKGVKMILDGAQRAKDLTSQIQTFSRVPSPSPAIIDVQACLSKLPDLMKGLLPENVRLQMQLAGNLGRICADEQQMEQILVNLSVNACHAMPEGGVLTISADTVHLTPERMTAYQLQPAPMHLRVAVADTGHGMERSVRDRIFEPFFTTKPRGQGTGLGLAIVYGIIQQLRGCVRVRSKIGEGTQFEMYFPLREEAVTMRLSEPAQPAAAGTETVLLVEDEDSIRALVSRSLQTFGYSVHAVNSGEDAVRYLAKTDSVELVISDIVMNKMSGFDLARHVRKQHPATAILLVSGYPQRSENGILEEIDVPFLRKPFAPAVLAARVRQVIDQHTSPVSV